MQQSDERRPGEKRQGQKRQGQEQQSQEQQGQKRCEEPVQRFALRTSDGLALRAERFDADDSDLAVVICHPHPLHGGNMFNPVVGAIFNGCRRIGLATLRFNFRGTNGSEGQYANGVGERLDALAAVEAVAAPPDRRVVVAGYSFGADIALQVDHPSIVGRLAVAPPLMLLDDDRLRAAAADDKPTLMLAGTDDQFQPSDSLTGITAEWSNVSVHAIDGADHFLAHDLRLIESAAAEFAAGL